mmetsp:Transcript_170731/g.414831  ORF Transcript_170731/g.414831 Transcript_170731/m.414831 type:complete len:219 (+) Transcript_170731:133-789(+)
MLQSLRVCEDDVALALNYLPVLLDQLSDADRGPQLQLLLLCRMAQLDLDKATLGCRRGRWCRGRCTRGRRRRSSPRRPRQWLWPTSSFAGWRRRPRRRHGARVLRGLVQAAALAPGDPRIRPRRGLQAALAPRVKLRPGLVPATCLLRLVRPRPRRCARPRVQPHAGGRTLGATFGGLPLCLRCAHCRACRSVKRQLPLLLLLGLVQDEVPQSQGRAL